MTRANDRMPVLVGVSAVAFSALYLLSDVIEAVHGGFTTGQLCFGAACISARVLPRWPAVSLIAGVLLVSVAQSLPEGAQVLAAAIRDLGFVGMGVGLLRGRSAPDLRPSRSSPGEVRCRSESGMATLAGVSFTPLIISAVDLSRTFGEGEAAVRALDDVSIDFPTGGFTAIMGASGSGKSTLMHLLAGLDRPTSGTVAVDGTELSELDDAALTRLRRDRFGFVFQGFNLVPVLNAEENILLPFTLAGRDPDRVWFEQLVATVGIEDRLTHRPSELSGGQQQRVAVARALVHKPAVVFADEPTGNLDSSASAEVLALLRRAADEFGQTIVMVTHDPNAASYADRLVVLADGRIVRDDDAGDTQAVLELMKTV
jgi:putative ABC transport system ATP-binding protein